MAKFELNIYNANDEIEKTVQRNKVSLNLYIKCQEISEKAISGEYTTDKQMFDAMKPVFLELFPSLTNEDYDKKTDTAEVLTLFTDICDRATKVEAPKN